MSNLNAELAQEIVQRTMKIIPFNVNVMDAQGIILASGKSSRIGDLHAGAQLVLAKSDTVEIDSSVLGNMPGAHIGINLPLAVRGRICGVVGITGEPQAVRQFGELVRMTAEMTLEHAQLVHELQRERRYREEFLFHLLKKTDIAAASLEAWAVRLGLDLARPRAVSVLILEDDRLPPDQALLKLQQVQLQLTTHWPHLLSTVLSPHELAVLEPFEPSTPQLTATTGLAHARLQEFERLIQPLIPGPKRLAMGIALPGLDGAATSYLTACRSAHIGRQRYPEQRLFCYYELGLPVLLCGLDSGWQAHQLRQPLQRLHAFDRKAGTLRRTLITWFAQGSHLLATAKALHIHRNTLDYRLQKIAELTGLDLAKTDDRFLLYIALQLEHAPDTAISPASRQTARQ
jgi:carbohydrate diacid regulator